MRVGYPLVVTYRLLGPIPAGNYHIVADGLIAGMPQIRFDVLWRTQTGDQTIVSFTHQYPSGASAQYEASKMGAAQRAQAGDLLVLMVTVLGPTSSAVYVPFSEELPRPTARYLTLDVPGSP